VAVSKTREETALTCVSARHCSSLAAYSSWPAAPAAQLAARPQELLVETHVLLAALPKAACVA